MKDKLKLALKIARQQMAGLICAAVIIAALVLSNWPTQGWFKQLDGEMEQSISQNSQISSLFTQERHQPVISPDPNAVALPLDVFPTQDVYQKGLAAVHALGVQSTNLLNLAVQLNTHIPLHDGALPSGPPITLIEFAADYKAAMDDDSRIRNWPPAGMTGIPPLMAGRRISDQEKANALAQLKASIDAQYAGTGANGATANAQQAQAAFDEASPSTLLQLEEAKAHSLKVYLETGALKPPTVYDTIKNAVNAPQLSDVWTAQLWLWLDEDVATAVARANADAHDVLDAPVKQILDVTIKDPPYLVVGDPTAGNDTSALTPAPDATPTGRVCNGMYDVVQFGLKLHVDATRVPAVLNSLQAGQFITVLAVTESKAVDSAEMTQQRFLYGKAPIVELDLVCEELLLHGWITKYQPPNTGPSGAPGSGGASSTSTLLTITTHGG
jgi:hypothetical protein